jgi:hypothetical protein
MRTSIIAAAALAFAGLAYADTETEVTEQVTDEAAATTEAEVARVDCIRYTGSRIRRPDGCISVPGSVYNREQLKLTGDVNTGEALSRLDPRVRLVP